MDIAEFLMSKGIRTYLYSVVTPITVENEIPINTSLSTELGWIYGISTHVNGCLPKDKTKSLPTIAQAKDLFVNFINGTTWYITDLRLTDMLFYDPAGAIPNNPQRFLPVDIPFETDLKNSIIRNPQAASGFSVMITFWYIPKKTYLSLISKGIIQQLDLGTE